MKSFYICFTKKVSFDREVKTLKLSIQSLGTFTFQTNVEHKTIYLITKSQSNRTLNMVYAMAYGCYIVSENWVNNTNIISIKFHLNGHTL
jgi:hypothetical protein